MLQSQRRSSSLICIPIGSVFVHLCCYLQTVILSLAPSRSVVIQDLAGKPNLAARLCLLCTFMLQSQHRYIGLLCVLVGSVAIHLCCYLQTVILSLSPNRIALLQNQAEHPILAALRATGIVGRESKDPNRHHCHHHHHHHYPTPASPYKNTVKTAFIGTLHGKRYILQQKTAHATLKGGF
jgi:hypothetical protein